jgi:hypothetical protein
MGVGIARSRVSRQRTAAWLQRLDLRDGFHAEGVQLCQSPIFLWPAFVLFSYFTCFLEVLLGSRVALDDRWIPDIKGCG